MTDGLSRVQVQGFGSLADVTLEPGSLTVLIGANGSGKSNLLRALKLAPLLRTRSLQTFVGEAGGPSALLHYGPKRTQALTLTLDVERAGKAHRYSARLGFAAGDTLIFLDESVGYRPTESAPMQEHSLGTGHQESRLEEATAQEQTPRPSTGGWVDCTSSTSTTRPWLHRSGPTRVEDHRYLRSDGSNLAAYLWHLQEGPAAGAPAWTIFQSVVRPTPINLSTYRVLMNRTLTSASSATSASKQGVTPAGSQIRRN
jgi:energy-coupling factor transporter ATP-binding protein EcfA2